MSGKNMLKNVAADRILEATEIFCNTLAIAGAANRVAAPATQTERE